MQLQAISPHFQCFLRIYSDIKQLPFNQIPIQAFFVINLCFVCLQTAFYAQSTFNAHFGLDDAMIIDTVKIEWPSGLIEIKNNINSNQFLIYTEGQ